MNGIFNFEYNPQFDRNENFWKNAIYFIGNHKGLAMKNITIRADIDKPPSKTTHRAQKTRSVTRSTENVKRSKTKKAVEVKEEAEETQLCEQYDEDMAMYRRVNSF